MKRILMGACVLGLSLCTLTGAGAQIRPKPAPMKPMQPGHPGAKPTLTAAEKGFMADAARGGLGEIALAKLALRKAKTPTVKQFAQRIVQDHGRAASELKQIAARKKVTLPRTMATRHSALQTKLSKLPAPLFEKQYMDFMVKEHVSDVNAFQKAQAQVKDVELKAWVMKTLPKLEHHLQMARAYKPGAKPMKPMKTG